MPPDPNDPFEGPAIIDLVRRFGDRIEFTTNLMPGAAGPDWLQVLNEPGWTSGKVLLTVAAALHTGSRVFRIRTTALLDLDDAELEPSRTGSEDAVGSETARESPVWIDRAGDSPGRPFPPSDGPA